MRINFLSWRDQRAKRESFVFLVVFVFSWIFCIGLYVVLQRLQRDVETYHSSIISLKKQHATLHSNRLSSKKQGVSDRVMVMQMAIFKREQRLLQFLEKIKELSDYSMCLSSLHAKENIIQYSGNIADRLSLHDFSQRFSVANQFSSLKLESLTERDSHLFSFTYIGEFVRHGDSVD